MYLSKTLARFKPDLEFFILFVSRILLLQILLRFVEYSYFSLQAEDVKWTHFIERSVNYDSLWLCLSSSIVLFPYLLVSLVSRKGSQILLQLTGLVFYLFLLVDTIYFLITKVLLVQSVFELGIDELVFVVMAEISSNRVLELILFLTLLSAGIWTILRKCKLPIKFVNYVGTPYFLILIIAWGNFSNQFKELKYFDSIFDFQLGNSKPVFYIKSIKTGFQPNDALSSFEKAQHLIKIQQSQKGFSFFDINFPLVHSEPYKNVLGKYCNKQEDKPNVVIVITESLSSSFTGSESSVKGLMPFTDSLIEKSLYWSNFISIAEKSYGVIPSLLASSPAGVGKRGFLNMDLNLPSKNRYPHQLSLIELLKSNGYLTNYFYGGWKDFDNTALYLEQLGVDNIYGEKSIHQSKIFTRKKSTNDAMVWGYSDVDLFNFSLSKLDSLGDNSPYLSLYQTLSIHSPYNLADSVYYSSDYQKGRLELLGNSERQKAQDIYSKILATIFYADDALKGFFEKYQKRDDFDNTIFIILGDHALDVGVNKNPLDVYRIPLLIYSELFTASSEFKSLNSQLDVLPTLLALLQGNFNIKLPVEKPWIGSGLDTGKSFETKSFTPLNLYSMQYPNFIYENQVIWGGEVYQLDSCMKLELCKEAASKKAKDVMQSYLYLNEFVCRNDKIWFSSDSTLENLQLQ